VLASANTERLGENGVVSGCRMIVRANDDISLHPHDVYMSVITNRLQQLSQPDWLDVGCGWHFDWIWEHEREKAILSQANVIGLDPDWQAVSRHRTISKRTVGTVESLPFASASFDLVTANVVVEHLKYPALAFAEIFRVLRPGGSFIFRTPSARSYFVRIARVLPQPIKVFLASKVIEKRDPVDIYPAYYRANTTNAIADLCELVGFRDLVVTIMRARGILAQIPALVNLERGLSSWLGMTDGNLLVEIQK